MKYRIYAYIHLVILIFYLLRPAMPYIEYAVNKDYIANHLCINRFDPLNCCEGKCYLEKQIKNSIDINDSKDNNTNKKVQNVDVNEFLITYVTNSNIFEANITYSINQKTQFSSRYVSAIFIPPQV